MWAWVESSGVVLALIALVLVNAVGVAMVLFQLPGTWLILAATTFVWWWRGDEQTISLTVIVALAVMALIGELIETLAGPAGSAKAGGSKRGAILALVGAFAGAIAGTAVLAVIGTILGACAGAAAGSMLGDRMAGRDWIAARRAAEGAAAGRFIGTIGKVACAVVMWFIVTIAVCVP